MFLLRERDLEQAGERNKRIISKVAWESRAN